MAFISLLSLLSLLPSTDDAACLLFTLAPTNQHGKKLEVLGLTINFGNSHDIQLLGDNACLILELAKRQEIPVYLGGPRALVSYPFSELMIDDD